MRYYSKLEYFEKKELRNTRYFLILLSSSMGKERNLPQFGIKRTEITRPNGNISGDAKRKQLDRRRKMNRPGKS